MHLEDVLAILGRVGTVQLRKGTNDVSATPGHKAHKGWTCEISLAGYNNTGGTRTSVGTKGETAMDAAAGCLAELERFLVSKRGVEDRARYVQHWETLVHLSGPRPANIEAWRWQAQRHPGPMHPEAEITYGD